MGSQVVSLGAHTVLGSVLVGALGLDLWHVFLLKEFSLLMGVRYPILIEVGAIVRDSVRSAGGRRMRAQNCVARLWVHNVRQTRLSNSELGNIPSLAVGEGATVQIRLFVLTGTHTILKSLEGLAEFLEGNSAHHRTLLPIFTFHLGRGG